MGLARLISLMIISLESHLFLKERLVKFQCRTCLIGPGISWTGNCPHAITILAREYHYDVIVIISCSQNCLWQILMTMIQQMKFSWGLLLFSSSSIAKLYWSLITQLKSRNVENPGYLRWIAVSFRDRGARSTSGTVSANSGQLAETGTCTACL